MDSAQEVGQQRIVFGDPAVTGELLQPFAYSRLSMAALTLPPAPADPFTEWVIAPAAALIAHLRERDGDPQAEAATRPLAILLVCPDPAGEAEAAARGAAIEALRGITQSVVREKTTSWAPVNAIAVDQLQLGSAQAVLDFLATEDSAFTAGATFDLISADRSTP